MSHEITLILSTRNFAKAEQIRAVFNGLPVCVLTLDEAGIIGDVIEDGTTLEENAFKKAHFAWERTHGWCIADDTGIFIDALDGKPGVHSARWAGEGLTSEDIMRFTLERLQGVALPQRTAYFKTAAAVIAPDASQKIFKGMLKGSILEESRATRRPKMPYSSIFLPTGYAKALSEMTIEEDNEIDHRGKAFRQVRDYIATVLT